MLSENSKFKIFSILALTGLSANAILFYKMTFKVSTINEQLERLKKESNENVLDRNKYRNLLESQLKTINRKLQ